MEVVWRQIPGKKIVAVVCAVCTIRFVGTFGFNPSPLNRSLQQSSAAFCSCLQ